ARSAAAVAPLVLALDEVQMGAVDAVDSRSLEIGRAPHTRRVCQSLPPVHRSSDRSLLRLAARLLCAARGELSLLLQQR
ncbi:MAG: hypothetical protein M3069_20955, partial [Chloroflexota bacterium]|nr:hypothetical protein [Chloroflexota bacterium]